MVYYLLIHRYSYPEDDSYKVIEGVFDNKEKAYEALMTEPRTHYESLKLYVIEEDKIYEENSEIKKYTNHGKFIMNDKKIEWHEDTNLIFLNEKLPEKVKEINNKINKLNELYEKKYERDMELYRKKEIRHPIKRRYPEFILMGYPYEKTDLEKFEKKINLDEIFIEKQINDLCAVYN